MSARRGTRENAGIARLFPILVAAIPMGFLLVSVTLRSACVTRGYEVEKLKRQRTGLAEDTGALRHRLDDLLALHRVEDVATERFGLQTPKMRLAVRIGAPASGLHDWLGDRARALSSWLRAWF